MGCGLWLHAWHTGAGGVKNYEYRYEDDQHPLLPTTILEYLDDDGDGTYSATPYRTTTKSYDDFGNPVEHRVYVDPTHYVLTTYDYHDAYGFPIRETTWKDLQNGTPSGDRVEKQWLYGTSDGYYTGSGTTGNYLVREKELLVDEANPANQVWKETIMTYRDGGQVLATTDPESHTTAVTYDEYGYQAARSVDGIQTNRYLYDAFGRKLLEADTLGKVMRYDYDNNGRVLIETKYFDEQVLDPCCGFSLSSYGPQVEPQDQEGYETQQEYSNYDFYNQAQIIKLPAVDRELWPNRGEIHQYYNGQDKIYSKVHWSEEDSEGNYLLRLAKDRSILTEAHTVAVSSTVNGNLHTEHLYDSMNREVHTYEFNYEAECFTHQVYPEFPNPFIKHTEQGYCATGQKSYEKVYKVSRDPDGDPCDPYTFSSTTEKYTAYSYDNLDRLIAQVEDPCGLAITIDYGYDAVGNQIYVIDPAGSAIFTDYDCAKRKIREYFAVKEADIVWTSGVLDVAATKAVAKKRTEYTYYANDKLQTATSYDNDASSTILAHKEYTYDGRGRITEVEEDIDTANTALTTYAYYDAAAPCVYNNVDYHIVITDPCAQVTKIALTPDGKPARIDYPSGDYEEISYYGSGLPHEKTVWDSQGEPCSVSYTYNVWSKATKITYPGSNQPRLEYTYTGGLLSQITDYRADEDRPGTSGSNWTFRSCPASRQLLTYTDPDNYEVSYDYNAAYGAKTSVQVTKLTDPCHPVIYSAQYSYDLTGRMTEVKDDTSDPYVATFGYDLNGNRETLNYHLDGTENGAQTTITYTCDADNRLRKFSTSGLTFSFGGSVGPSSGWAEVDGLGRLTAGTEGLTDTGGTPLSHTLSFEYDRRSQLTGAAIQSWTGTYTYYDNGNLSDYTENGGDPKSFGYNGQLLTSIIQDQTTWDVTWENNGNLSYSEYAATPVAFTWNWDNRLRSAEVGDATVSCKYAPDGERLYRKVIEDQTTLAEHKYIVDPVGAYPTVLMELDAADEDAILRSYIHADGQTLCQYNGAMGGQGVTRKFYLHDRLGSVRQMIDADEDVVARYTYDPYGNALETDENGVVNPYRFADYWWDEELHQYFCNARWYDPALIRFTRRDPVKGAFSKPLTLSPYLYCRNDPINCVDPGGLIAINILNAVVEAVAIRTAGTNAVLMGVELENDKLINFGLTLEALTAVAFVHGFVSGGVKSSSPFTEQQQALISLAKRGDQTGITRAEAKILLEWANEYDVKALDHMDTSHWIGGPHIKIGPYRHIKVID